MDYSECDCENATQDREDSQQSHACTQLQMASFEWMAPAPQAWALEISRHGKSRSHDNDWITIYEHHRDECTRVSKPRVIVDAKTATAGPSESTSAPTPKRACDMNFQPIVKNGWIAGFNFSTSVAPLYGKIIIKCDPGYEIFGDVGYVCSRTSSGNMLWQKGSGSCVPGVCLWSFVGQSNGITI